MSQTYGKGQQNPGGYNPVPTEQYDNITVQQPGYSPVQPGVHGPVIPPRDTSMGNTATSGQPMPVTFQPQYPGGIAMGSGPPQGGYNSPGQPTHFYQPPEQPGGIPMGQPTTIQPGQWANIVPGKIPNCPPGLEYLAAIDQLLVHQKVELLEAFTGFETKNKYVIKNGLGQNVYWAVEDCDWCTRNCCGPARPFQMQIFDIYNHEVLHLDRPLACQSCCCPCCLQTMEVTSPAGIVLGRIEQNWSFWYPNFSLKNAANETILKIEGPFCTSNCGGDVEFKIKALDGTLVGKISKQWTGLVKEIFTDADNFGITFPLDLDVGMKAVCLGALFLIDFMYFEKKNKKQI